jgi:glycosyltransferase involved in cell wall biosynthesis
MHICHCFKVFDLSSGGVEQIILELSYEHMRAGHTVSVLASSIKGRPKNENIHGINVIRTFPLFEIFKVPIMPNYYRCLSQINPDIVHAHGAFPGVSDIAVLYATRNKKPSVLDYQFDGNAETAIGNIFAFTYNHLISPLAVSSASQVTATSRSYAETSPVLKNYLDRIAIIPNGVDLDTFTPDVDCHSVEGKYGLPPQHIIFYAGRFVPYKGVEFLIRAMQYVPDGTLIIAGKGKLEHQLKTLVKNLNLTNVRFLGIIPHEDLPELYKVSDVYVIPSITRGENFGISALEAMACGTAVVASNLPGVRELVTDECGIKVEPKDSKGMGDAINVLLADEDLRLKMGSMGRKNAENYSWSHIARNVLNIYEKLLS